MADVGTSELPYMTVDALIEALSKFSPSARVMLACDAGGQIFLCNKPPTLIHSVNPSDEGGVEWCRIEFSDGGAE